MKLIAAIVSVATLIVSVLQLRAADLPVTSQRLPLPITKTPAMPVDGTGIYRLSLDGALGIAPLVVVLQTHEDRVTQAVSLPTHIMNGWCPTDASKLTIQNGKLSGTLMVEVIPPFTMAGPHSRRNHGKPNPKYASPYELVPAATANISIDAKCDGTQGAGTYAAKWSVNKGANISHLFKPNEKGSVSLTREPIRALPKSVDCDLYLATALGDSPLADGQENHPPAIWLRLSLDQGKALTALGYVALQPNAKAPETLSWSESTVTLADGKLIGRLSGTAKSRPADSIKLDIRGQAIGRRLFGTVTSQIGDMKITTQWVGYLNDSASWRLPTELPTRTWDWQHDRPADQELTAQAREESLHPVLPGEPGKAGFWTWRPLMRSKRVSVIYPPSFDIQETKGATKYRFTVVDTNKDRKKETKFEFTAEKPWRPLSPIWNEMQPGSYDLTVTPLDAQDKLLPGPMRLGIIDKATAKPTTVEMNAVSIVKRPSFSGPYTTPLTDWHAAALATSRFHRESLGSPERHGHAISQSGNQWTTGGDHGFGVTVAAQVWANLATRALTNDVAERLQAEELLAFVAENFDVHQRQAKLSGTIYDYQSNTPMSHWPGTAMLDAYLETGDPRWREMALKLGHALVKLQNENGSFCTAALLPDRIGPHGFFSWREGYTEYSAVEILYLFGRLRRDLKTDAFAVAEKKAYDWTMNVAVRERLFPLNLAHSMSQGYPIWMHGVTALYLSRYLLECAPPERRDLKLAEDLARWAEDHSINWQRAPEGKQTGPLTPRLEKLDRYNNEPAATNLLAAIVFQELAQATGNKLWFAKGDALTNAVLQGRDAKSGRVVATLQPADEDFLPRQFHDATFRHNSFCGDWSIQLLREYASLRATKELP